MSFRNDKGEYRQMHAKVEGFSMEIVEPKTLYVGNLDNMVTDEFLATLFGQLGEVVHARIFSGADLYAFIEFSAHSDAVNALQTMNGRMLLEKPLKVNWAVQRGQGQPQLPKVNTSNHFHVFVGDLSQEIDNAALREAFAPFGEVSDAKVILDLATMKSKGYGFVSFPKREDAETALEKMNGQWLGTRAIRTNWATRKPGQERNEGGHGAGGNRANDRGYDEIYNATPEGNTSVYVGGLAPTVAEEGMRAAFERFGSVQDIRIFKAQHYAFIKFDTKDAACQAILQMNGGELAGSTIRCSWGKAGGGGGRPAGFGGNMGTPGGHYGYMGQGGFGGQGAGVPPVSQEMQQQYWQFYAQHYNNPQAQQQYANYWQTQQHLQQNGQGGAPYASGSRSNDK